MIVHNGRQVLKELRRKTLKGKMKAFLSKWIVSATQISAVLMVFVCGIAGGYILIN